MSMSAKSEATIARILDAAEALFVANSFVSVSMQDIADQIDVSKGALYHHFESKEALFVAMMLRDLSAKQALFARRAASEGDAQTRLRDLTRDFFELPLTRRRLIQLVRRDINHFNGDNRASIIRAYQAALPDQIERIIEDGIAAGEIASGNSRLLAWSFVALVEVVLTQYAESVFHEKDRMLNHVLGLFFSGTGAQQTQSNQYIANLEGRKNGADVH